MTNDDGGLDAIRRAVDELLPELTERLSRHGLGEIEVRDGDLRLRISASPDGTDTGRPAAARSPAAEAIASPAPQAADPIERARGTAAEPRPSAADAMADSSGHAVSSPAIGYFVYGEGLGPGLSVEKGDPLGYVEMLGVRHDVRAPRSGRVRNLVAESGEPVEYGQVVVELEPIEAGR
jgi:acetyl-CoA carboxylase biotin carboxyl carrier protein